MKKSTTKKTAKKNAPKTTKRKKANSEPITRAQANSMIAEYAEMRGLTKEEAELALIACGWNRIRALSDYAKKGGAK